MPRPRTSSISASIDRALRAPTPHLQYLQEGDVYSRGDVYEARGAVYVVGHTPHIMPGQVVRTVEAENYRPRRYVSS